MASKSSEGSEVMKEAETPGVSAFYFPSCFFCSCSLRASYVVVDNDFVKQGVTFENPNAYANLTKDLQEKAKNGDYRERLTEYINLNDGLSLLNRHFPELGKVVVMWDKQKESVNMTDTLSGNVLRSDTIRSTLIDKFGSDVGNFLADQLGDVADEADEVMTSSVNEGLQSQNASLNSKLFLFKNPLPLLRL